MPIKKTFEGYFCKSRGRQESFEHTLCLSKSEPMSHTVSERDWIGQHEVFLVPQSNDDIVIDDESLWHIFESGRRYRITVEDIEQDAHL